MKMKPKRKRRKRSLWLRIRKNTRGRFLSGLLVVVPLGITIFTLTFLYNSTAGFFEPIIRQYLGYVPRYAVPTVSVIVFLSGLYLIGLLATAMVGRNLIALGEAIIRRIPVVTTVYGASKQMVETLSFSGKGANFKSVAIVDFPRPGMKAIGFITGTIFIEGDREYYKVFITTTPNPTSGYFEIMPSERVTISSLTVEEAIKLVMSGGIIAPDEIAAAQPEPQGPPVRSSTFRLGKKAQIPNLKVELRTEDDLGDTHDQPPSPKKVVKPSLWAQIKLIFRSRLLSGMLVIVPLGITVFVLNTLYDYTAGRLVPVVKTFQGELPDYAVPAMSIVVLIVSVYLIGFVATVVVGRQIFSLTEAIIRRTPLAKTIYGASKQVVEAISFREQGSTFSAAVLVEFPFPGMKAVGFMTGSMHGADGKDYFTVFIPTTPNISVGLFELVAPEDLLWCDLSVEEAIKMALSAGLIAPERIVVRPGTEARFTRPTPDDLDEEMTASTV